MPLAKIHVVEGRYDQARIAKISDAIQATLMNTLCVPPEDFYQLIFELPKNRFLHTSSFLGMHYTDDLIVLDVTFIHGRPKETRLALLKDINTRVAAAGLSPDDMMSCSTKFPARTSRLAKARHSAPPPSRTLETTSGSEPNRRRVARTSPTLDEVDLTQPPPRV